MDFLAKRSEIEYNLSSILLKLIWWHTCPDLQISAKDVFTMEDKKESATKSLVKDDIEKEKKIKREHFFIILE